MPKKGKARLIRSRRYTALAKKTKRKKGKKQKYVRIRKKKVVLRCQNFSTDLPSILGAQPKELVCMLIKDGICKDWTGQPCPHCGKRNLGSLEDLASTMGCAARAASQVVTPGWRCPFHKCRKRVFPNTLHPIFAKGHGALPLRIQAAALFCAVTDIPQRKAYILLGEDNQPIDRVYNAWRNTAGHAAKTEQEEIKLGDGKQWRDAEADEVTTKKWLVRVPQAAGPPGAEKGRKVKKDKFMTRMQWDNWLGLMQRGVHSSLISVRLPSRMSSVRAPGPGPLTQDMWRPIAQKWLTGRKVILHMDSAKAYRLKVHGMKRDRVVHSKKKIGGKWVNPTYVTPARHRLPDGTILKTLKGTQCIDGLWKHLRAQIKDIHANGNLESRIRHFQWRWHRQGKCLWTEAGKTLSQTWV